jgi:predicted transcriptional regulator
LLPTSAALVENAAAFGLTQAEIANELGIDEKTLRKHFRVELSSGKFKGCGEANAACAILA